jgi:hypothetical protein
MKRAGREREREREKERKRALQNIKETKKQSRQSKCSSNSIKYIYLKK